MPSNNEIVQAIKNRFVSAIESLDEDAEVVCKKIGLNYTLLSHMKNNPRRGPRLYHIYNLEKYYGVSSKWVIMGQ